MEKAFRKINNFLERHPSIDTSESGDTEVNELDGETRLQAITTETTTTNMNTVLFIPSAFKGETFLAVYPKNCIISIVPRNCEVVQKNTVLLKIFNLRFIESQNASDPQLQTIYEMVKAKDPEIQQKVDNLMRYYSLLTISTYAITFYG